MAPTLLLPALPVPSQAPGQPPQPPSLPLAGLSQQLPQLSQLRALFQFILLLPHQDSSMTLPLLRYLGWLSIITRTK